MNFIQFFLGNNAVAIISKDDDAKIMSKIKECGQFGMVDVVGHTTDGNQLHLHMRPTSIDGYFIRPHSDAGLVRAQPMIEQIRGERI